MDDEKYPLKVPLVHVCFWVQVHDLPSGFFFEYIAKQLGDFLGNLLEYDTKSLERGLNDHMQIRVRMGVRCLLKRKNRLMFPLAKCLYVNFKYERLTLFYFFYGCLGHIDFFCQIRIAKRIEIVKMGWDQLITDQSRKAITMNNIWLRGEG